MTSRKERQARRALFETIVQRLKHERRPLHILPVGPVVIGKGSPVVIIPNHGYDGKIIGKLIEQIYGNYTGENTPNGCTIVATSPSTLQTKIGEIYYIEPRDTLYAVRENIEKA